jgi:hypothetical protein
MTAESLAGNNGGLFFQHKRWWAKKRMKNGLFGACAMSGLR